MISVLLHTVQDLGDHGENRIVALDVGEDMTIKELSDSFLKIDMKSVQRYQHIEIRICKAKI